MPPRINQIKAVALEAQIELWLATVQRGNCLIRTQDKGTNAVAIVMEGRESDTRNKYGLPAGKLWKLPLCGSTGKIKLQKRFFHCFHIAWKTLRQKQKRGEFSTVTTASAAGFYLTGKTGRNLLRAVARNLPWEAHGEPGTWLAAKTIDSRPAREKFFLDSPLS